MLARNRRRHGTKAWDFCDRFCNHRVALFKAEGKDILDVSIALNRQLGVEAAEQTS